MESLLALSIHPLDYRVRVNVQELIMLLVSLLSSMNDRSSYSLRTIFCNLAIHRATQGVSP
jgi:hypothetical protein